MKDTNRCKHEVMIPDCYVCYKSDTNTLREEFEEYRGHTFSEDQIDFAINKFNQKLEEIERGIEECSDFADSGDTLKQRILQIIKNKKN